MKGARLLVWLTQLGLSTAIPLAVFVLLAVWLRDRFSLGAWVIVLGCVLGLAAAVRGLMDSMKIMQKIGEEGEKKPYMPEEKARDLMERNPEVRAFVADLGLDTK